MEEDWNSIQVFKAANGPVSNGIDFVIQFDNHEWKVHGQILAKKSGYFRAIYEGEWMESQQRKTTITESNLLDVARLIQFIYVGVYDYDCSMHDGVALSDLLSPAVYKKAYAAAGDRQDNDIDEAMFELGRYFDIPLLRSYTAGKLIFQFEDKYAPVHEYVGQPTVQEFKRCFCELYEKFEPYFRENKTMDEVESTLVKFLLLHKFASLAKGQRNTMSLKLLESNDDGDSMESDDALDAQLRQYARRNGSFALKLAISLERGLDTAVEKLRWKQRAVNDVKDACF